MKTYFQLRQEINEKSNFASTAVAGIASLGLLGGGIHAANRYLDKKYGNQGQQTTRQVETRPAQPQIPQQVTQQPKQEPKVEKPKTEFDEIADLIHGYESRGASYKKISAPFLDHKNNWTIGHGHLITDNSHKVFQRVFPDEHKADPEFHRKVLKGKKRLTHDQMKKLMHHDISTRIPEVQKMVPDYDKMPIYLKKHLASEYYRGGLGGSPKAVAHIKERRYDAAAKEYLNSDEYRAEKARKESSVADRFDSLHDALMQYHQETKGK